MNRMLTGLGSLVLLGALGIGCSDNGSTDPGEMNMGGSKDGRSIYSGDCITFDHHQHCPIGNAMLSANSTGNTLHVSHLSPDGGDGVDITLPDVAGMKANIRMNYSGSGNLLNLDAFSGGSFASRLGMSQNEAGDGFSAYAMFTNTAGGSLYTVNVYSNGQLQGTVTDIGSTQPVFIQEPPDTTDFPDDGLPGCEWTMAYALPIDVGLPDGTVLQGDRIEFVEQVDAAGSYTYRTFETLKITSNANSLDISNERTVTAH